ncbi:MAG: SRPBCC domain-containing protein [Granulosicoccus sp.]|nr:SRPBCC domain-containing protein [Granulosicoccus sp.]
MLEPIKKSIEVPCNQEKAFTVFVNEVNNWWPLDKNTVSAMGGEVAQRVVIEPKANGKVYEIGHDETEHVWGSVTRYDPFNGITLDWHIGLPAENASEVSVEFTELDNGHTQVLLTHSRWEAFGDKAADMRAGYDGGWVGVFEEAYKNVFT